MFHETIRKLRRAKGLSQEDLAVRLHVVRQTVSKWENGRSVPDADVLIRMAEVLDVSVSELLGTGREEPDAEALAEELARVNEQLAVLIQREERLRRAGRVRGGILCLSFLGVLFALSVRLEWLSLLLTAGCMLGALGILYRNLALLTSLTTEEMHGKILKVVTLFDVILLLIAFGWAALDRMALLQRSEDTDKLLAMGLICAVMLFGGWVSPKLPFTVHTGLRLPWTVRDEETWQVAHRMVGIVSIPVTLFYLAGVLLFPEAFGPVSLGAIFVWIGIPGGVSALFFWRKFHRKR